MLTAETTHEKQRVAQQGGEGNRLWLVDFIRQISILLVLATHFFEAKFTPCPLLPKYWWCVLNGEVGVWMFFIVSGFVIANTISKRFGSLFDIKPNAFYTFRAARLIPLFLAAVMIGSLVTKIPVFHSWSKYTEIYDYGGRHFAFWLTLFTGTFNWYRVILGRISGMHWDIYWSLAIEEQFYAVFPLALKLKGVRLNWKVTIIGIFLVAPLGRYLFEIKSNNLFKGMNSFCALDLLTAGILLHIVFKQYGPAFRKLSVLNTSLFALGLVGAGLVIERSYIPLFPVFAPTFLSAAMFAMLFGGLNLKWLQDLPQWMVAGGKLSYGAYILHPTVLFLLAAWMPKIDFAFGFITFFLCTMTIAWISFNWFENPMNHLIKKHFALSK